MFFPVKFFDYRLRRCSTTAAYLALYIHAMSEPKKKLIKKHFQLKEP